MRLFEMDVGRPPLLVLVHPGSACGSANFNLGNFQARAERDGLILDLTRWKGAVLVADGELSDELPDYPQLNGAILGALQRADDAGFVSRRIAACAHEHTDWTDRILHAVKSAGYVAGETIRITGAWVGEHGCVNATQEILQGAGYHTDILDSAIHEADEDDDDDVDEDGQP